VEFAEKNPNRNLENKHRKMTFKENIFPYSTGPEFVFHHIISKFTCIFIYVRNFLGEIRQKWAYDHFEKALRGYQRCGRLASI
jgi:hypothetical protein